MAYLPRSATPSQRRRAKLAAKLKLKRPTLLQFLFATILIIAFVSFFPVSVKTSSSKSNLTTNPNPWGASATNTTSNPSDFGTVIGIDLGTTYSCVGVQKPDGSVEIIPNSQGNRITPSYVSFSSDGERLIGDAAKNQAGSNPSNTVFDAKRFIGRSWEEVFRSGDTRHLPFKVSIKFWRRSFA